MRGFRVSLADGTADVIEASTYDVVESGELRLVLDGDVVATRPPERWVSVHSVGTPVAESWPDDRLTNLVSTVGEILIVRHGHGGYHIGPPEKYASEALNDFDSLTSALLAGAGIRVDSADDIDEVQEVRAAIAAEFDTDPPEHPPAVWPQLTELHCPICGDCLLQRPAGLSCPSDIRNVALAEHVLAAIETYLAEPPTVLEGQSASVGNAEFWFCPADGFRLRSSGNAPQPCTSCHRVLPDEFVAVLRTQPLHGFFQRIP